MNRFILGGLLLLVSSAWAQNEGGFLATVTPGDRVAAGLDKLTPSERSRLQALVEAYKNAPSSPVGTGAIAQPVVGAASGETVVLVPGTKIEYATIKSTVAGNFDGWKPGQVLRLANGQRWRIIGDDRYYIRSTANPEVEVTPSKFGGYWMKFPTLKARVRVELVGP